MEFSVGMTVVNWVILGDRKLNLLQTIHNELFFQNTYFASNPYSGQENYRQLEMARVLDLHLKTRIITFGVDCTSYWDQYNLGGMVTRMNFIHFSWITEPFGKCQIIALGSASGLLASSTTTSSRYDEKDRPEMHSVTPT
jgi:hypothetical protein